METTIEKDCSAIGGLFQSIISDMRGSSPVWEDFAAKATKLQSSLKTTLVAIGAFLEAFQKVADLATGSRGATKEIGSALTRLCMRHRSIETKLKSFSSSILENLVSPVQEKLEEWKKTVAHLDKEHAKEYKKARQEIKRAASDTVRLQKKVKKVGKSDIQYKLDSAMQDVNDKYLLLEETEKTAVRNALIEERNRFCLFITCLKPFVDHEVSLLTEVTHLQEIMDSLCLQASDPHILPPSSEQVILDLKGLDSSVWNFQTPPSSPSSLGSRKSSMCSISSITSSSSGSTKSHSPSHHARNNSLQVCTQLPSVGTLRLTSVSSQDSGFTSQDTLFHRPATPSSLNLQRKNSGSDCSTGTETPETDSTPSTPSENLSNTPSVCSTWNNWPNQPVSKMEPSRPHTISSAYEKNHHTRPPLTSQLFEPPQNDMSENKRPQTLEKSRTSSLKTHQSLQEEEGVQMRVMKHDRPHFSVATPYARPASINKMQPVLPPLGPKPKPKAVPPPKVPGIEPPIYANLTELAKTAAERGQDQDSEKTPTSKHPPTGPHIQQNSLELADAIRELQASTAALENTIDTGSVASQSSLQCSSGYGTMNNTPFSSEDTIPTGDFDFVPTELASECEKYFTIPRNGVFSTAYRAAVQQAIRPASTAGIPVSQGGLGKRNSVSTPKPPPPVRRSSSITTASPAILQRLRSSPPKQLNSTQQMPPPGPPVVAPKQHRRSRSESNPAEPAYAELQTIQQSIQTRNEHERHLHQQHMASPYALSPMQGYAMSAPPTPQYSVAVPTQSNQGLAASQAHVIQSLNSKFASLETCISQDHKTNKSNQAHIRNKQEDDLPLPPTDEELLEIERIYSRPSQPKDAIQTSLLSELKQGPKLRRVNSNKANNDTEC